MATEDAASRLARLEREVDALNDYAAVRENGLRNERELTALRSTVNDLTKTLATAAISFALSAIAIVATLVGLFK